MVVQLFVPVNNIIFKEVKFVKMAEYTAFGLDVKTKLLGPPTKTQAWLAREISCETGLAVDDAYLSKILTGQRNAPKIVQAIQKILDLPERDRPGASNEL